MDINMIIAWGASFAVSVAVVSAFIKKYAGKAKKGVAVARETLDLLDETLKAIEPDGSGKVDITAEEVARIRAEAEQLLAALKALKE